MDSEYLAIRRHEHIVELIGELDLDGAPDVLREAAALDGSSLTFDLSGLTFVDSSGIAALLRVRREHPNIRIIAAKPRVRQLFAVVGVADILLDDDSGVPPSDMGGSIGGS
jgi:anti-anti-sigma factor